MNFTTDVWQLLLSKTDNPKDYYNTSLVCLNSGRASKFVKSNKANEFRRKVVDDTTYCLTEYYVLPNQTLHGEYSKKYMDGGGYSIKFEFGKQKNDKQLFSPARF